MDATQRVRAMLSFVQAADRGSFAAAARALGISSAAVGKNVAGLEGALGVRLMNRSTRSLQLTSEGQAFLQGAREAIDALDAAIDTVAAQRAHPQGRVRVSTSNAFGHRYLLPLLPRLAEKYPAIVMELDFDDRKVDIVRDGFDIAVRGGQLTDSSLESRHICNLVTVLVAAPSYLAKFGVPKRVHDLDHHRLIAVRFLTGQTSAWTFAVAGALQERLPEPCALVVSDPQAAVEAAVSGMGIAQIGLHHAWIHLKAGQLKVVLAKAHHSGSRSMALQYPHRALVAPRVRVTVDFLLQELAHAEALHASLSELQAFSA
ncbi:LysR family transcriptional regulator [Rhodoferax aquaticus]|uniref:LysR family transcriptional regulator n=1 Tax=Rhodoferax aquaticus TaxID=2527691 RepID=A0A515ELS2_9BURK|nr:LysR family transcriptional regulator [Rhodoferax aquaticus]QDL53613.1 LysR family transcriptional regulator [Rhodoferax aquaticus]